MSLVAWLYSIVLAAMAADDFKKGRAIRGAISVAIGCGLLLSAFFPFR